MTDGMPYIIVDNQKLSPISRTQPMDSPIETLAVTEKQIIDIIDRVTISAEARQKAKQILPGEMTQSTHYIASANQQRATTILLTYSPEQLR